MADKESGTFAAAHKEPGPAAVLPHGCEELVGVDGVNHEVGRARAVVAVQDFAPGLASVRCFVDPAVFGVAVGQANGSHPHGVGVARMHHDSVNPLGGGEAHGLPGLAAVQAAKEAAADGLRVAGVAFAGAHPNHVGVAGVYAHGAN